MTRLLPLLLIALLVIAACGGSASESTPAPTEPEQGEIAASPTPTPDPMPSPTPEPSPTEPNGPAGGSDGDERETDASEQEESEGQRTPEAGSGPSPTRTLADPVATPEPSPTPTPPGPIPVVYPTFPPVPEIATCEQAADLTIDSIQVWLDALGMLPTDAFSETFFEDGDVPEVFDAFAEQLDIQMGEIVTQTEALGCTDAQMEALIIERIDQLTANNPNAELFLEALLDSLPAPDPSATPDGNVEPTEEFINVPFDTCEQAADIFIELMQNLVFDVVADWTVEDLNSGAEPTAAVQIFIDETDRLRDQFMSIGCSEVQVTALVGERLDRLVVTGEAGQEIFAALEDSIAEGNLFEDLN